MKESFVVVIDKSVPQLGYGDRSKFIRDAIREKLARDKVAFVSVEMSSAPSRAGKGGKPTHQDVSLNDSSGPLTTPGKPEPNPNYKPKPKRKKK